MTVAIFRMADFVLTEAVANIEVRMVKTDKI